MPLYVPHPKKEAKVISLTKEKLPNIITFIKLNQLKGKSIFHKYSYYAGSMAKKVLVFFSLAMACGWRNNLKSL